MSNEYSKSRNIEYLITKISYELVNDVSLKENEIDKLLGILSRDGVYAMWVWSKKQFKKKKDSSDQNKPTVSEIFEKFVDLLKLVDNNLLQSLWEGNNYNYEKFFQGISEDLTKLLFLKQLMEKTLIYARYHAKALESGEEE